MIEKLDEALPALDVLPLPGAGHTLVRWQAFADLARRDLSLTRLAEGHADATAILAELGRSELRTSRSGPRRLGVWAAQPNLLHAEPVRQGWILRGTKGWCSGSLSLDAALVTATAADGPRLFLVGLEDPAITAEPGSWQAVGMADTCSETLHFDGVRLGEGAAVGGPDAYVNRPGFGHGGVGVAACWWGGALGLADSMAARLASTATTEMEEALGLVAIDLEVHWQSITDAARQVDACPTDVALSDRVALRTRVGVEAMARRVLGVATDALGSEGLCHDPDHARRVTDLTVYLSQLSRRSAARTYGRLALLEGIDW